MECVDRCWSSGAASHEDRISLTHIQPTSLSSWFGRWGAVGLVFELAIVEGGAAVQLPPVPPPQQWSMLHTVCNDSMFATVRHNHPPYSSR